MRLRAIIVDDEESGIATLELVIDRHIPDVKIVASCNKPSEAIELIENYKPEIVFLDVNMPEMNGFDLLEKLQWKNFNLIFTTAHQEYALKALKNNAIDYLLKPVYHKELQAAIERIKARQQKQEATIKDINYTAISGISPQKLQKLGVVSKDGVEYIDPSQIISMQSKANYTLISLENGKDILTSRRLGEFETILFNYNIQFMRVHHSFIINLQKVLRYIKETDDIVMTNSQKIPLSKSRRENFFKWLN